MKYLIVNADDFGYSLGINRGIVEAHENGVVTSTSLMVDEVAASEASVLTDYKKLSVGLHFVALGVESNDLQKEFERQLIKFQDIIGREPDHVDTHKITPNKDANIRDVVKKYTDKNHTPVRSFGQAKYIRSYFGLNSGGHGPLMPERVSLDGLRYSLGEVEEGYNELMCHVGYSDDYLRNRSSYNDIREQELKTLTSSEAREFIEAKEITLCNWRDVKF